MNRQFIYKIVIISIIMTVLLTSLNWYNSKENVLKSSLHNAEMIADIVNVGLASPMATENAHQIDTYLSSISDMKNINSLWLVRSELVNKHFK